MDPILQGLQISLLGMILTFLALGVFILIMVGLKRFFPPSAEEVGNLEEAAEEAETPLIEVESADESEEGAVVAAISAALSYFQARQGGQLGQALQKGRSGWWAARRAEAHEGKTEQRR